MFHLLGQALSIIPKEWGLVGGSAVGRLMAGLWIVLFVLALSQVMMTRVMLHRDTARAAQISIESCCGSENLEGLSLGI